VMNYFVRYGTTQNVPFFCLLWAMDKVTERHVRKTVDMSGDRRKAGDRVMFFS